MSDNKGVNRLYLVLVISFVAVSLIAGRLLPADLPRYVSLLMGQMAVLLPALLYCRKRKIAIWELVPYRKISFSTGVLVVVSTYLVYPLMVVLNAITLLFTDSAMAEMQIEMTEFNVIVSTLLIAVLPAFVEEFVFRGVLFQTYRKKRVFSAVLLSAFLFGCMHMNLNQLVYAFAMGIYMAFLVEATGSIISSMLAHFVLNFTGVALSKVLTFVYGSQNMQAVLQQTEQLQTDHRMYIVMMLAGIMVWFVIAAGTMVGAVAIYIQICKMNGRLEHVKKMFRKTSEEKMVTIPLLLGVGITMFIIIRFM